MLLLLGKLLSIMNTLLKASQRLLTVLCLRLQIPLEFDFLRLIAGGKQKLFSVRLSVRSKVLALSKSYPCSMVAHWMIILNFMFVAHLLKTVVRLKPATMSIRSVLRYDQMSVL